MSITNDDLSFMIGLSVRAILRVGTTNNILIEFESATLNVETLWRLRKPGQLITTSMDTKSPEYSWSKDSVEELQRQILNQVVCSCNISDTEDLILQFENGSALDVICDSTMFESWQLDGGSGRYYVGRGW
jgi:hypothetical protein